MSFNSRIDRFVNKPTTAPAPERAYLKLKSRASFGSLNFVAHDKAVWTSLQREDYMGVIHQIISYLRFLVLHRFVNLPFCQTVTNVADIREVISWSRRLALWWVKAMFVERLVSYSALFTFLVRWNISAASLSQGDVILGPASIMFCLLME
jgi:hypothetical protein